MVERTVKRADAKLIADLACDLADKATDWKERALAAEEALKKFAGEIYAAADAATETADFYAARYAERCGQLAMAQARITALEKALESMLASAGWRNYSDDELREEIALGNDMVVSILAARKALKGDGD